MNRSRHFLWASAMAGLVALTLVLAAYWGEFPAAHLYPRLAKPLLRLSLAIGVGLLIGILIENANLTARLGGLFIPLLRFGHLKEPSAAAFTTAFFSVIAASSLLMSAHQDGTIGRRELIVSALMLTFPAFFTHLPSMFFVITPLVGVLGFYYLAILLAADLLRTAAYLLYARLTLPPSRPLPFAPPSRQPTWREIWQETRNKFARRLFNVLVITLPIFVAIFLAQEGGFFEWLRQKLILLFRGAIPVEAVSILIFSLAAETTGGFAAAGALLTSRALSPGTVLFTLILGTILASPMRAVRHQLSYYLGIYTPALGLKLMVFSQLFRTLSLLPFLGLIYLWGF